MRAQLQQIPGISLVKKPELIFLASLLLFAIDNVVNYFTDLPVFTACSLILLPLMWLSLYLDGKKQVFLVTFSAVFITTAAIGNLAYTFNKSSIADLTFILMFATAYFYYKPKGTQLVRWPANILLLVSILLFGFGFFGINSMSLHTNEKDFKNLELIGISFDSLVEQSQTLDEAKHKIHDSLNADSLIRTKLKTYFPNQQGIDTMKNLGITMMPGIKIEKESLDKVEQKRHYTYGLFRVPHVPAYFFGFTLLLYIFLIIINRKWVYLLPAILLSYLILLNGVRTFIVAAGLSVLLWFFVSRNIWYFVAFSAIGVFFIVFRYEIFEATEHTILSPLSSLLITTVDNPDRLSRVALFRSWLSEIKEFSWLDLLTGKNFYQSKMANLKNLFTPTWYHNDLLSIIFSYGIPAALFYVSLFVKIYLDNRHIFRQNAMAFIFFFTMILTSIFNGFYYYFPIFLIYIFWLIAYQHPKPKTA